MAKFRIGERVRLLREEGDGIVQAFLPNGMVEVLLDDIIEVEVPVNEVVKIHAAESRLRQLPEDDLPEIDPVVAAKKAGAVKQGGGMGLSTEADEAPFLGVFKNRDSEYELWVMNPGVGIVLYSCYMKLQGKFVPLNAGEVRGRDKHLVSKLEVSLFHNASGVVIQVLRHPVGNQARISAPYVREIMLKFEVFKAKAVRISELEAEGHTFLLDPSHADGENQRSQGKVGQYEEPDLESEVKALKEAGFRISEKNSRKEKQETQKEGWEKAVEAGGQTEKVKRKRRRGTGAAGPQAGVPVDPKGKKSSGNKEVSIVGDKGEVEPARKIMDPLIVDLHIENLVDSTFGMDAGMILQLQLTHFDKILSEAHGEGRTTVVFIHGIGTGKLKKELHQRLREIAWVRNFELGEPRLYGNGATVVHLR